MQNKDFFSGVPIEMREFLLRLLNCRKKIRTVFQILIRLKNCPYFLFISLHRTTALQFRLKPRRFIHILCLILRIHNRLVLIQSIISRSRIADRNRNQIKRNSLKSKHFKCDQNAGYRAVRNTCKQCDHTAGCTKRWRKSQ